MTCHWRSSSSWLAITRAGQRTFRRSALLGCVSLLLLGATACKKSGVDSKKDDEAQKTAEKPDAKAEAKAGDKADSGAKDGEKPESAAKGAAEGGASKAKVAVTVAKVELATFTETVEGPGVVSVRSGHVAALAAPAPTRITNIYVALGAHVTRGTKLIAFETTAFDAAVASTDAALNAAEQSAARAKRLVDAGVSPRKDAELATAELAAARSNSVNAHRALQLANLVSPIDGVVTRLSAVLGANADIGQTLVEVADTHALDVQITLSPSLAAKVHSGQFVTLHDGSAADAAVIANGKIADVSAVIDSGSRGVVVRVTVANQKRVLRIGESVYGRAATAPHTKAIVINDDALVPTGEGFRVFVVDAEQKAHATAVTIGGRAGHRVWISDGLKAGDTIVTTGAYGLDDGATVVTKKAAEP